MQSLTTYPQLLGMTRFDRLLHDGRDNSPVSSKFLSIEVKTTISTVIESQTDSTEVESQTGPLQFKSLLTATLAEVPSKVWYFDSGRFGNQMVRQEYHDALEAIIRWLKTENTNGPIRFTPTDALREDRPVYPNPFQGNEEVSRNRRLVVVGLPGIGKTTFLRYLWIARIALNLPTLLCEGPRMFIWKDNQLYSFTTDECLYLCDQRFVHGSMWCLFDVNDGTTAIPSGVWETNVFIMRAASPRKERFEWASKSPKQVKYFFMREWSAPELIAGLETHRKWTLGDWLNTTKNTAVLLETLIGRRLIFRNTWIASKQAQKL
ncbi:hypothetical protein GYMLUDRAFT_824144 [Collybiopsis luxurians FD-317 M1]|uniref:Uncharacterized protein n=1 Tax=Collybiopsis luxurians FD-317 M1 TaxID=944289 RepID=A0A0D0C147_9AGAR|nr:hypothetical protein GYMLUDRAFT_824144 [Collybiopsis luxurians FD-317 M1]